MFYARTWSQCGALASGGQEPSWGNYLRNLRTQQRSHCEMMGCVETHKGQKDGFVVAASNVHAGDWVAGSGASEED